MLRQGMYSHYNFTKELRHDDQTAAYFAAKNSELECMQFLIKVDHNIMNKSRFDIA